MQRQGEFVRRADACWPGILFYEGIGTQAHAHADVRQMAVHRALGAVVGPHDVLPRRGLGRVGGGRGREVDSSGLAVDAPFRESGGTANRAGRGACIRRPSTVREPGVSYVYGILSSWDGAIAITVCTFVALHLLHSSINTIVSSFPGFVPLCLAELVGRGADVLDRV